MKWDCDHFLLLSEEAQINLSFVKATQEHLWI